MAVSAWELVFYETIAGQRPVQDYLNDLSDNERAKVTFHLDLLSAFGLGLGAPHVRGIRGKLWELRATGHTQHRIFYFAASGRRLVLLHAFTKKTPRTPPAEIHTAARRMDDYLERMP
ncbi:MAG: type II toxin-antitoxin system RelE/ParE family toxin [Chloroflexi bacterium]|nr:type II toxin-antitoxin system RelE/ParE family toxin [Chloroflexota bacterium]